MNCFIIYSSFWDFYSGIYDDENYSLEESILNVCYRIYNHIHRIKYVFCTFQDNKMAQKN